MDNPHEGETTGHDNHIHAYGWIDKCRPVPSAAIELWLYRLEIPLALIKHNLYKCPEGYGQPNCYLNGNMRAVIDYRCNVPGDYAYKVVGHMWIDYGGTRYEKWDEKWSATTLHCD